MHTPVLFMVFNRPELTKQTFEAIRKARPPRLYIAADGPRGHKESDFDLCRQVREIVTKVDWPCTVRTLFRRKNLGCALACSSAITWFFRNEPEGIILEDDCLAQSEFFSYCEILLERYRHEPKVMVIGGSGGDFGKKFGSASYYFTKIASIWGWASWSSVWQKYDLSMQGLLPFIRDKLLDTIEDPLAAESIGRILYGQSLDRTTWDWQLTYCLLKNGGFSAQPNAKLVRNIGNVEDSVHCQGGGWLESLKKLEPLGSITHPETIDFDRRAHISICDSVAIGVFLTEEEALFREGMRRLEEGDTASNRELLSAARALYGPKKKWLELEIHNLLAEKDFTEAKCT